MNLLRYTLVADGSSDQALIPILTWLLRQTLGPKPIQGEFSDLRRLPNPPNRLAARIDRSAELFPCELLFVHRDAERATIEHRVAEIRRAVRETSVATWPMVCVVPVRMQEAWLLIDETALRAAAGNPNGKEPLDLPGIETLEGLPNPKQTLHELLRQASGLRGRRLRSFNERLSGQRVAELIEDFRPLYRLVAFQRLSADVARAAKEQGWSSE
ncbi:MAG: hypothetical protein OXJ90_20485 [Spirochaetaceae bacterium]|nr:hypothetical protein [Spirochaetaceae bacterium]